MALLADGCLLGWGDSTYGELGCFPGEMLEKSRRMCLLKCFHPARGISVGARHAVILLAAPSVEENNMQSYYRVTARNTTKSLVLLT